ncbi:Uncharacterised protein [BD1-7 clade bacterium]|uniref:Uncharacterized protein n=1 Tax=BD1-7 clade bacterium TaxID=2029982 RepID=A0A5S9R0N4_9GAMM|nr:Uncharacterised protein [BD1-7 clade bacterium]
MTHLFLVSTQFNALMAASVAHSLDARCVLMFIDQKRPVDLAPWENLGCFANVSDAGNRQAAMAQLQELCSGGEIGHIYTGNDRRIEFQAAMIAAGSDAKGHYLDDGLYSYTGFSKNVIADCAEFCIKSLRYRMALKRPPFIGGSRWISEAHLLFPDHALPGFRSKSISAIDREAFLQVSKQQSARMHLSLPHSLSDYQRLVLLPHSSVISAAFAEHMNQKLAESDETTLVKTHPRDCLETLRGMFPAANGADWLGENIPFEWLLCYLADDACIISGASSTLMTARWLKPKARVVCLESAAQQHKLFQFYQSLGIQWSNTDQDAD